jgi:hypothetical protein
MYAATADWLSAATDILAMPLETSLTEAVVPMIRRRHSWHGAGMAEGMRLLPGARPLVAAFPV